MWKKTSSGATHLAGVCFRWLVRTQPSLDADTRRDESVDQHTFMIESWWGVPEAVFPLLTWLLLLISVITRPPARSQTTTVPSSLPEARYLQDECVTETGKRHSIFSVLCNECILTKGISYHFHGTAQLAKRQTQIEYICTYFPFGENDIVLIADLWCRRIRAASPSVTCQSLILRSQDPVAR